MLLSFEGAMHVTPSEREEIIDSALNMQRLEYLSFIVILS